MNASKSRGYLALIQTSLLFSCKCKVVKIRTTWFRHNKKWWGPHQNKVTSSFTSTQRPGHWADNSAVTLFLFLYFVCVCVCVNGLENRKEWLWSITFGSVYPGSGVHNFIVSINFLNISLNRIWILRKDFKGISSSIHFYSLLEILRRFINFTLSSVNNFVTLSETVEVGCPRHPGATTIGNQLQDGDRTDGWQNPTTQPWAPTP